MKVKGLKVRVMMKVGGMMSRVRDPQGHPGKAITGSRAIESRQKAEAWTSILRVSITWPRYRPSRQQARFYKTLARAGLVEVPFPGSGYTSLTPPGAA